MIPTLANRCQRSFRAAHTTVTLLKAAAGGETRIRVRHIHTLIERIEFSQGRENVVDAFVPTLAYFHCTL